MRHAIAPVLGICWTLTGCGSPLGDCRSERIDVNWPATIERGAQPESAELSGQVAVGNVGAAEFATLRAVLTGDASSQTDGAIWTVPAFDDPQGWVAIAIQAPVGVGDVLPVDATIDGAGWGPYTLPAPARIVASIRAGSFAATSVTGTVKVLAVGPLRLRLDLTAHDGSASTIRLTGDAAFQFVSEPSACT
jgi:hypothetical protein